MEIDIKEGLSLRHGETSFLSFISIDIAGSSKIVRTYKSDEVHDVLLGFRGFVNEKVEKFGGFVLEWEGDGGVIAMKNDVLSCVICSIEITLYHILFNLLVSQLPENVNIRIAVHGENITYNDNPDEFDLSAKELADDLQKQATPKNDLIISDNIFKRLPNKVQKSFKGFFFEPLNIQCHKFIKLNFY